MGIEGERKFDLEERMIQFAQRVINYVDSMPNTLAGKYYGGQLLRSGGSPALQYGEAQGAESNADFIHKCRIALKELKESNINLRIQAGSGMVTKKKEEQQWLLQESAELVKIMATIIRNAQRRKDS